MFKEYKKRFLIYPVIFAFLWFQSYNWFYDEPIFESFFAMAREGLYKPLSLNKLIDESTFMLFFGYLIGYVYGTLSQFIRARHFTELFSMVVVFVIKIIFSIVLSVFAIFTIIIELITIPFYLKRKKGKESATTDKIN